MRYLPILLFFLLPSCEKDGGCYTCTSTTVDRFSPALGGGTETSTFVFESCDDGLAKGYNAGMYDTRYNSPDLASETKTRCK